MSDRDDLAAMTTSRDQVRTQLSAMTREHDRLRELVEDARNATNEAAIELSRVRQERDELAVSLVATDRALADVTKDRDRLRVVLARLRVGADGVSIVPAAKPVEPCKYCGGVTRPARNIEDHVCCDTCQRCWPAL